MTANISYPSGISPGYRYLPSILLGCFVLLVLLLAATDRWMMSLEISQTAERSVQRLGAYRTSLDTTINRHHYLPRILASDPRIVSALANDAGDNPGAEELMFLSVLLQSINLEAQSDQIFLMDTTGMTHWSSNYDSVHSFVGSNYSFRPYFTTAMAGQPGFYFAVGATSGEPGLFLSSPVYSDLGDILGVIVVKIDLRPLEQSWLASGDSVWVTDQEGIIFLSSSPRWQYHATRPLDDLYLDQLAQTRQYGTAPVMELTRLDEWQGTQWQAFDLQDEGEQLAFASTIRDYPWQMHLRMPLSEIRYQVRLKQGLLLLFGVMFAGALLYYRERHRRHEAQRALQQANEVLEQRVEERTRDLKEAQAALAQNQKLAALGRMSSAIAHEINQPITALRNYTASSRVLLERNSTDIVRQNLEKMDGLTERLSALSRQLRIFSGKRNTGSAPASLHAPVHYALDVLQPRLDAAGIDCRIDLGEERWVLANAMMLEQILVNLLSNAIDALADRDDARIFIRLTQQEDARVSLQIGDNGPGMDKELQTKVFEPFFTTKSVGEGMGLAISYSLAHDMGAELTVSSEPPNGTCFSLTFNAVMAQPFEASA
ncbi:sensor histidine kinase [Nitrincola alkalilacustris]|uniref:sensor histidine kinase n=1 Tax=Nitrincola alkalilacustris TaxID=1571224 RepID=UPI00124CAD5B|nr:ATP-binding protein [Nitrincola alkalilacustris]